MGKLASRTCLVTGGGSVGAAAARLFVGEGARVMLVDRCERALTAVAAALPRGSVEIIAADLANPAVPRACVAWTLERFVAIDVLFASAGGVGTRAPIAAHDAEAFDPAPAVDAQGAFLTARAAAPHMTRGGSIVIASAAGDRRVDVEVYAGITAGHAQLGLMRCLARELAPRGVRVNIVHPAPRDDGFLPAAFRARANPEGIARSALYLASDESGLVTGRAVSVDGGLGV